jgi:Zn-dependent protease with chaperone function
VHLAVYLPLLVPLAAALSAGRLARRLDPRLATWLLTTSAVALAAATATVLSLLVVAGLIQIPVVARLGKLSQQVIRQGDAPSMSVALLATGALSAAIVAAARMTRQRVRVLRAAAVQARHLPGTGEVVIMEDDEVAEAFTVPGRPGRIVVSTGMLAVLQARERAALLAHERAHLRAHHHCSPPPRNFPPLSIHYCARRPARSPSPSNGGPTKRPPPGVRIGAWSPARSRERLWPKPPPPGRVRVPRTASRVSR